jgi:hypothetical protein
MEAAMMLDDVHSSDVEERIRKHEAVWSERLLPELEWDETEDLRAIEELLGRSNSGEEAA